jgi:hypothetical protein
MSERHVLHVEVRTSTGDWVPQPPVFGSVEFAEAYGRSEGLFQALGWRDVDEEGKVHEAERSPYAVGLSGELAEDEGVALFQRARIESLPPIRGLMHLDSSLDD